MQGYESELTDLKRELALLSATLTPAHYRVQEVQAQIEALEAARDAERTNIIRRLEIEYESRLAHEQQLRRDFEAQSTLLANQSDTMTQYNILRREVETNPDYAAFIAEELVPLIDSTYKTAPTPDRRAILGVSYGGVNAAYCGLVYPEGDDAAAVLVLGVK